MSKNLKLTAVSEELKKRNIPLVMLKHVIIDNDTDVNKIVDEIESDYQEILKHKKSQDQANSQARKEEIENWSKEK